MFVSFESPLVLFWMPRYLSSSRFLSLCVTVLLLSFESTLLLESALNCAHFKTPPTYSNYTRYILSRSALSGGKSWPCWHVRPSLYFRTASSCHFLSNVQSDNNISSIIWCWYWCGRFGPGSTVTHSSTSCICLCVQTKTAIVKSLTSNSATNTDPLMCSYTYCIDGVCVCVCAVCVCLSLQVKVREESFGGNECNLLCHYFQRIVAIYYVGGTVPADDAGKTLNSWGQWIVLDESVHRSEPTTAPVCRRDSCILQKTGLT